MKKNDCNVVKDIIHIEVDKSTILVEEEEVLQCVQDEKEGSKIVVDEEIVISRSGKEATMIQKAMSNYYFANDHKEELYSFQAISNLHRNREKVSII